MLPNDWTIIIPIATLVTITIGLTHGIIASSRAQRKQREAEEFGRHVSEPPAAGAGEKAMPEEDAVVHDDDTVAHG